MTTVKSKEITIEPTTREDYEMILKEQYGSSWRGNIAEIGTLMDYKENVGDLKGMDYSEVMATMWDL